MENLLVIYWVPEKLKWAIMGHPVAADEEARPKVAIEAMLKAQRTSTCLDDLSQSI